MSHELSPDACDTGSAAHGAAETEGGDGVSNAHWRETKRQITHGSYEATVQHYQYYSSKFIFMFMENRT